MIGTVFQIIFYEPLYNALVFLVGIVPGHDVGIAVIVLTLVVQFILFPFRHKSVIAQRKMKEIEPEVKRIKEQFKKNKGEQTKQIMALYKAHGVSPFSGFLMLLIQLPVFFALYKLFLGGISFNPADLYSFVRLPETIQIMFLGLIDISKNNYVLAFLAGLTQFLQMQLSFPKVPKQKNGPATFQEQLSRTMSMQAKYFMPLLIFFIALKLSSAITLYWTTMNVFAIVHEIIVSRKAKRLQNKSNL